MTSDCGKREPVYRCGGIHQLLIDIRTMKSWVHQVARRKEWTASGGTTASDWCTSRGENARVDETYSRDANFSEANGRTCVPHHPPPYDSDPNGAPAQSVPWARARLVDVRARAPSGTRAPIRCRLVWFTIGYYCAQCSEWTPAGTPCLCQHDPCGCWNTLPLR